MGEPFGRWSSPPSRSEYEDRTSIRSGNSFARPSGKSIYNQRKDYGQSLLQPQSSFQHHVEHLLTVSLERDIRSVEECLERLRVLEAQGRVWGQDLILQVQGHELVLRDVESKEELESHPLGSVQGCWAALDIGGYDSVLAIGVRERSPPGTSVLLFQCERLGAEVLKGSLEKLVKQWKEEQRGHYGHRSSLDPPPSLAPPYAPSPYTAPPYTHGPHTAPERWAETPEPDPPVRPQPGLPSSDYSSLDTQQMPPSNLHGPAMTEVDRDVEILNHVLGDLDLFVERLRRALGNSTGQKKKRKKNKGALPPQEDYVDFFQKVKYALNLVGRNRRHLVSPDPPELLRLLFTALSFVLEHCPDPRLPPEVEPPLLGREALELLEETLDQRDHQLWKSLGSAWNQPRAEYPHGELVPRYTPVFSDGWLPPPRRSRMLMCAPPHPQAPPSPPQRLAARVLYDFQSRNPQELSVRMGDVLQVLDQRKKWWLVQDGGGDKGYVPSNILEPLGQGGGHSPSQVGVPSPLPPTPPHHQERVVGGDPAAPSPCPPLQESPPNLLPDSSPAEVTAWLKDKGFSRITVRCLGVLRGQQLLQMSPEELRAVCPEEWRRVLFKLSSARTSLGLGPRD
ncbi:LOW QUALITY PROTEIN: epidermal growth factor receptor kinase substrate 8-like protein 3 [Aegotheles albertisi]